MELTGVRLHMIAPDPVFSEGVGGNLDLRWTSQSPRDGIVKSDIPAFYAKRVAGLKLRNVQVDWAHPMPDYFSDGLRIEDFKDLTIDSFAGRQAQATTGAAISLQDGWGVSIANSRATPGTHTFVQLDKVQDRRVFVNYDVSGAAEAIMPATERFENQVGIPLAKRKPVSESKPAAAKSKGE